MSGQSEPHERPRSDGYDPTITAEDWDDLGRPGELGGQPPPSPGEVDPGYQTPPSPPKNE